MNDLQNNLNIILEDKNTNLLPENLRAGVTALGVEGTMLGVNNQEKTANQNGEVVPDDGYTGLSKVTVNIDTGPLTQEQYDTAVATATDILDGDIVEPIKLNVYCQETEPENKDGIWCKTSTELNKVITTDALVAGERWEELKSIGINTSSNLANIGNVVYYIYSNVLYKLDLSLISPITETVTTDLLKSSSSNGIWGITIIENTVYYGDYVSTSSAGLYKINLDTLVNEQIDITMPTGQILNNGMVSVGVDIYFTGFHTNGAFYKYNTITNTLTQLNSLAAWVSDGNLFVKDNYIYLVGCVNHENTTVIQRYDLSTGYWENIAACPEIQYACVSSYAYDDIFLFGGYRKGNTTSAKYNWYKYNILTNTWTKLANLNGYVSRGTNQRAITIDNKLWLFSYNYQSASAAFASQLINPIIEFESNSIVLLNGNNYQTNLFGPVPSNVVGNIGTKFNDLQFTDDTSTIIDNAEIYYGNGTEWIKLHGEEETE